MYKRIILKISGEAFAGDKTHNTIDDRTVRFIASEIIKVHEMGDIELGVVVGGGNIIRGSRAIESNIERTTMDYMGMLATVINALALQSVLESLGMNTRVQSSIDIRSIAEPYIRRRALRHFEKGRIVIFAAGTGNPYFSTDTAAVLKASELSADLVIKATFVDGVYDKDPKKHSDAIRFKTISYQDVIDKKLKVMDETAIVLARDNNIPIIVLDLFNPGMLAKAIDEHVGTYVGEVNTEVA